MKKNELFLLAIIALCALSCGPKGAVTAEEQEDTTPPPLGFRTDSFSADTTLVRSGDTFTALMRRLGMGANDAYRLSTLCGKDVFDLRKLRAGNHLHA